MDEGSSSPVCPSCGASARLAWRKDGFDIFACTRCALRFVHPVPDPSHIYSEDYFAGASHGHGYVDYEADKRPMVPTFERYLRLIAKLVPPPARLLDVGAATGFFAGLARRFGYEAEGVEISDFAAAEGRRRGLPIRTGTLFDVSGEFGVITMLDVIEHVPDPKAELARAYALLRPRGALVINTPDAGSLYARLLGPRWHLIVPPEHLYYFNRANLTELLRSCGFEVVWVGTIGKRFTLPYVMKTLHAWLQWRLFAWLGERLSRGRLGRIGIPINLRDNMLIIAKRP